MEKGLIYISMLDTTNITQFTNINELLSIQSRLAQDIQLEDSDLSIEVYTSNREEVESGSVCIICNTGGLSVEHPRVVEIFNNVLNNNESLIQEVNPHSYLCGLNIGSEISLKELQNMKEVIMKTSDSATITSMLEVITAGFGTTETSEPTKKIFSTPVSSQPVNLGGINETPHEGPKHTPTIGSEYSLTDLAKKVIDILLEGESDARSTIEVLNRDKEKLTNNIVEIAKHKIDKYIEEKLSSIQNINTSVVNNNVIDTTVMDDFVGPEPLNEKKLPIGNEGDKLLEDISKDVIKDLPYFDNNNNSNKTTNIYDNLVTLENLMKGCENDNQLFNEVVKNKDNVKLDDLENVSTFNMFESLSNNETVKLGFKEQKFRKQKLGL